MTSFVLRPAERRDAARLGQLAAELVRQHHRADPERFLMVEQLEQGYATWLRRELARDGAVVLVAEQGGEVVGYAYGTIEERDWVRLLDEHGEIHDLFVDATARRAGVGRALLDALVQRLEALGARRIVLSTRAANHDAQRVFAAAGFRTTMIEMTRSTAAAPRRPPASGRDGSATPPDGAPLTRSQEGIGDAETYRTGDARGRAS